MSNEENQNDKADEKRLAGMVLSSKSETELVENLIESEKRFSELKERLDWTSGRLHYHILRLRASGFVAQGPKGYHLTEKGKKIAKKYL